MTKIKIRAIANIGEDLETLDWSHIAGGKVKWQSLWKKSRMFSYKNKHVPTISPSWALLPEKYLCSHENLYMKVHSSFIRNGQNLTTTSVSFNVGMVKQTVVYPYNGILLSNKKEQAIDNVQQLGRISRELC